MGTLRLIVSLLLLLSWAAADAGGGIYKWVDEKGAVHYRDTPPPVGGHYEVIKRPAAGPGQDPAAVMEELHRKVDEADKARANEQQRQQQQQQQRQAQDLEALRIQNCQQARQNLEILARSQNVVKEVDGKRVRIGPEQRQEEIQKNQKFVDENCKQP